MPATTTRVPVLRYRPGAAEARLDSVAIEEPLELLLGWTEQGTPRRRSLGLTMRTPGRDLDLALGLVLGDGLARTGDVAGARHCGPLGEGGYRDAVVVELKPGARPRPSGLRLAPSAVSCGLCGRTELPPVDRLNEHRFQVPVHALAGLPGALLGRQPGFARSGGLHAAGLFAATGELIEVAEDIGRHNAVDKLVGWRWRQGRAREPMGLLVSGRSSFEIVQKAAAAGLPLVAAVGAPSSLAIECARDAGLALVGFVRERRCTVYAGRERVLGQGEERVDATG